MLNTHLEIKTFSKRVVRQKGILSFDEKDDYDYCVARRLTGDKFR